MELYESWRSDDDFNLTAIEGGLYPCAIRFDVFYDNFVQGGPDDGERDKKAVEERILSAGRATSALPMLYN